LTEVEELGMVKKKTSEGIGAEERGLTNMTGADTAEGGLEKSSVGNRDGRKQPHRRVCRRTLLHHSIPVTTLGKKKKS